MGSSSKAATESDSKDNLVNHKNNHAHTEEELEFDIDNLEGSNQDQHS